MRSPCRLRLITLALALLTLPAADALVAPGFTGPAADDDAVVIVTDPRGDASGRADLVRVDGVNATDALTFRLHVDGAGGKGSTTFRLHYRLHDAPHVAEARVNPVGRVTHADVDGEDATATWSGRTLTLRLPWGAAGDPANGTTLTDVRAVTLLAGSPRVLDETTTGTFLVHRDTPPADDASDGSGNDPPANDPAEDEVAGEPPADEPVDEAPADEPVDGAPPAEDAPANTPPSIDAGGDRSVNEGEALTFTVNASDADGDDVTLTAPVLPGGASFDGATGRFTWTPDHAAAGAHGVTFRASDGAATAHANVTITVRDVNRAPVLDAPARVDVLEGADAAFTVTATDPDGDAVSVTATGLPEGAAFDAATGRFTWTPGYDAAGTHEVTVRASDGHANATAPVRLVVRDMAPDVRFSATGASTADAAPGDVLAFPLALANHADGTDVVELSVTAPEGWRVALNRSSLTLAAGADAALRVDVTPDARTLAGRVLVHARSAAGGVAQVALDVRVPVTAALALEDARVTVLEDVRGSVHLAFRDGTPARGFEVALYERAELDGSTRAMRLVADASGRAPFVLSADPFGSHAPGEHTLEARAVGVPGTPAEGAYAVHVTRCVCVPPV